MNKDLSWCRTRIDEIDEKLMALFEERMTIVLDVARYKKENNLPIFNKHYLYNSQKVLLVAYMI